MKHEILLTDEPRKIAEGLANNMPDPLDNELAQAFHWWQQSVDDMFQELGRPSGFLKICYKNNPLQAGYEAPEQQGRICRTCDHRYLSAPWCHKYDNKDLQLAWPICQGENWMERRAK